MLSQGPSGGRGWDPELAGTASFGSIRWPQLRTGDSADRSKRLVSCSFRV